MLSLQRRIQSEQAASKRFDNRNIDVLAALNLLEVRGRIVMPDAQTLINGPGTLERRLAIHVALHVAQQGNVFAPQKFELLQTVIRKLEAMATLQPRCVRFCLFSNKKASARVATQRSSTGTALLLGSTFR